MLGWTLYTFIYHRGKISIVLDKKVLEHELYSAMLKPYTCPYLHGCDYLLPDDELDEDYTILHLLARLSKTRMTHVFEEAKKLEYEEIVKKGGFKPIQGIDLPMNLNFIGNRYVLTLKDLGTVYEEFKSRLILKGH